MAVCANIFVLLVVLFPGVVSQDDDQSDISNFCLKLQLPRSDTPLAPSSIFFDTFTAQGVMEGLTVVGNSAVLSDITLGSQLSPQSSTPAILVGRDVDFRCGSLHGNLFYEGSLTVGPRVDDNGFQMATQNIQTIYDHMFAFNHHNETSSEVFKVRSGVGGGISSLQGNILRLIGNERATEVFTVSCADLSATEVIWFQQIVHTDVQPVTIIINIAAGDGETCSMDISRTTGWRGVEIEGSRIIWNFPAAVNLQLSQTVVGSILAPQADIQAYDSLVEGQIIANSLNGSIYGILNPFDGCIPTDPCAILGQDCEVIQDMPVGCIEGQLVTDPNHGCCQVWDCKDSCEDKTMPCPTVDDFVCPTGQIVVLASHVGNSLDGLDFDLSGSDPCCDGFQCVDPECPPEHCDKPVLISCPQDILHTLSPGSTSVELEVERGVFIFTSQSFVQRSIFIKTNLGWDHFSCDGLFCTFSEGVYLVMTEVMNDQGGEPTHFCNYEIKVIGDPGGTGACTVGGQVYDNGADVRDSCNRLCICIEGALVHCTRVRPELQTMPFAERQLYFEAFLAVYDHDDEILKSMINEHVQFFSRGLHNNGAFLPWHRGYLLALENRLGDYDCRITLPVWDWSLNPAVSTANIWGDAPHQASGNGGRDRCVTTGNFGFGNGFALTNGRCLQRRITGSSTATSSSMETQLFARYPDANQYDQFRNRLEHGPGLHDSVHCIVGGTMCSARSSNDPVFWSHHANIDQVWALWQRTSDDHKFSYSGNTGLNSLMPASTYTPAMMLDMQSLGPSSISVIYIQGQVEQTLRSLLGLMTSEEIGSIGNVAVGPAGKEWLDAMDMPQVQQEQIRDAEEIANAHVVEEVLVMTLKNGVERGLQMPGLAEATAELVNRLAVSGDSLGVIKKSLDGALGDSNVHITEIWKVLQHMFVAQGIVPSFFEMQDILLEYLDDGGSLLGTDTITVPVPVGCGPGTAVCGDGINFPNECVANSLGVTVTHAHLCPLPPTPQPALSPDVDGGASEAYNHQQQELSVCPLSAPVHLSPCDIDAVRCYYGVVCCDIPTNEITVTCQQGSWFRVQFPWNGNCDEALCGLELSNAQATVPPPTDRPTRSPTLPPPPTRSPTRRPTPPPTLPSIFPRPSAPAPASVTQRSWGSSQRTTNNRRTNVVSWVVTSPTPPILDTLPTTGISNTICPTVICDPEPVCCESGSSVGVPSSDDGCDQCPTCISGTSGLPTVVPPCCASVPICGQPPCGPSEVPSILIPTGPNGLAPCCPTYQCHCPECPTLADANCQPGRVPRFASALLGEVVLDTSGCRECNIIRCVAESCPQNINGVADTRSCQLGPDVTRNPLSIPPCQFHACVAQCPNPTETQDCPAPGGVNVPRVRNMVPQIDEVTNTVVCPWEPCPDYEPCDDVLLPNRLCNGNGRCRRGETRRIVCICDPQWNGEFCNVLAEPPRRVWPTHTRSFLLTENCNAFLCYPTPSGRECYFGNSGENFGNWIIIAGCHTILAFSIVDNEMYCATAEGALMTYQFVSDTTSVVQDLQVESNFGTRFDSNSVGLNFAVYDTFSYRTVVNNELPPPSEYMYVINSEIDLTSDSNSCNWWVYLTEENVVFYNSVVMVKQSWLQDDDGESFLLSTETVLCEDLCVGVDCGNGVCERTTGVCKCYFGWYGTDCSSQDSNDAITEWN